jgi:aminopeptidase N
MLRGVLGETAFYEGLAAYRELYQGRNASSEDLRAVLEASSGRDLSWFFAEWIYGMNRPHYVLSSFSEEIPGGHRVYVHLDQSQTDAGFFTMPVPIRIAAGGNQDHSLERPDHDDLVVDVPTAPTSITCDPDRGSSRP